MTPAEWLEHLRSKSAHAKVFTWTPELDKLISALPSTEQKAARDVWQSRVGRTIGQILDEQFQREVGLTQLLLDDVDQQILSHTHFGLYLTNDFNAWAGFDPDGENRVVVIHEGLPHTLLTWAHCYVRYIELGGTNNIEALSVFPPTISYMEAVWNNSPHQPPQKRPSKVENTTLSEELYNTAICFIIAHEIGHIRFGHSGYTDDISFNHQMEFDADSHGLKVATKFALARSKLYDDSWVYKFSLMAPLFVMSLLGILGNNDSNTHPSASRRLDALIEKQEGVFLEVCGEKASKAIIDFLDSDVFDVLARNSRNILQIALSLSGQETFLNHGPKLELPPTFYRV